MYDLGMAIGGGMPYEPAPGERPEVAALAELAAAIRAVGELDVDAMADLELHEVVVGLGRLTSMFEAQSAVVLQAWDARRAWASDRSRSARARLARSSWDSPAGCGRRINRAKKLRTMPRTEAAYLAGQIGSDRVDVLARANAPHRAAQFAKGEQELLTAATTVSDFDDFARMVRYWIDGADVEAGQDAEARARRQRESRGLDLSDGLDGVGFLNGQLDAVDKEIFGSELRRIEHQLFLHDWAVARERHGDDARADQLDRTARQRRLDALIEMAHPLEGMPRRRPAATAAAVGRGRPPHAVGFHP
jgi:hypothetical protein